MFSGLLSEVGLSLDRLQSFCLVAEAGGVTKAAHGNAAKQSLFSRQVKDLEEFFGVELIRRKGRGVVLTDAGERLHTIAREYGAALTDFRSNCKNQPTEVVIATGESVIQWLLLPHLEEIKKDVPNVRIRFLNMPTADAVKRLSEGLADIALVRKDAVFRPLQAASLGVMRYSLFIPARIKAASEQKTGIKILEGLPLATLEGDGSFRNALAQTVKRGALSLNIQMECSSFPIAAKAVARGTVAAILPSIAGVDLPKSVVRQVDVPFLKSFDREMCLVLNARLARIRPILAKVAAALGKHCQF